MTYGRILSSARCLPCAAFLWTSRAGFFISLSNTQKQVVDCQGHPAVCSVFAGMEDVAAPLPSMEVVEDDSKEKFLDVTRAGNAARPGSLQRHARASRPLPVYAHHLAPPPDA